MVRSKDIVDRLLRIEQQIKSDRIHGSTAWDLGNCKTCIIASTWWLLFFYSPLFCSIFLDLTNAHEMKWMGFYATFVQKWAKLCQECFLRMVRWMRWHWIRTPAVWGRARYLSVTEASHNIESLRVSGWETFCFFETSMAELGSSPLSPTFHEGSFNHCTMQSSFPRPEYVRTENWWSPLSKCEALTQCCVNVSLALTLTQHYLTVIFSRSVECGHTHGLGTPTGCLWNLIWACDLVYFVRDSVRGEPLNAADVLSLLRIYMLFVLIIRSRPMLFTSQ